ncbi:AIPR family protein [Chryseobacterium sp. YR221]|uniref:AIPR family protein n=1 Tax=Chryseobacterium sp. YR221 TaxID=1500293 RepID=UPI0009D88D1D|nr:AIPR family protein [Chryseobacterium sp. YR221]SMC61135.1 AIPR protein [Chryseobacterium sp. YR221]
MTNNAFYEIVDNQLDEILIEIDQVGPLPFKKIEQRKSYAFLVWIIKFYGLSANYKDYITDGPNDQSCDIIFNKKNQNNEEIFYVIQSKWNMIGNIGANMDAKDIKQAINDFETILTGNRQETDNLKFNKKNIELQKHLAKNGRVKFLFIGLCNKSPDVSENVDSFKVRYSPKIDLEILDINRIKRDYIETMYKEVVLENPLEFNYKPENVPVIIEIDRYDQCRRDLLEFSGKNKAYIFLIKPKVLYNLFKRFGFQLFYRNLRNPLPNSNYNIQIAKTLLEQPDQFWYFNNGITGISSSKIEISALATEIVLQDLQLINGAQTAFTVYQCYEKASKTQRKRMDDHAKISFRLIVSNDSILDRAITQFTNSQNPLRPADFYANDPIQERLQIESYAYNIWYEKRRGEFRNNPDNVNVVDKEAFARIYVATHLEEPVLVFKSLDNVFQSAEHYKDGLYEFVFNDKTCYSDMLASFYLFKVNIISTYSKPGIDFPPDDRTLIPFLTLSKIVLHRCLMHKFQSPELNLNTYILRHHEDESFKEMHQSARSFVATNVFNKYLLNLENEESQINFNRFMSDRNFFADIKEWFKQMPLSFEIIEKYNKNVKVGPLKVGNILRT